MGRASGRLGPSSGVSLIDGARPLPIFIVEEVWLHGQGLAHVLAAEQSLDVLGAGPPDASSLERIAATRPYVVLIDSASARGGFVRRALEASPGGRVVALGVRDDEEEVLGCAEAGVAGYIEAAASLPEVVESLRALQRGVFPCPAAIASILLRNAGGRASRDAQESPSESRLTKRESDIIALVDRGLSNKQIAAALSIHIATVKNHIHHILEKLRVSRRGAAAAKVRARPNEQKDLGPDRRPPGSFTGAMPDDRIPPSIAGHRTG